MALGVTTNQAFLSQCLAHPVFAAGGATTAFIGDHQAALLAPLGTAQADSAPGLVAIQRRAAAAAALLLHLSTPQAGAGHVLSHRLPTLQRFQLDGALTQGSLAQQGPQRFASRLDGHDSQLAVVALSAGQARLQIDGLAETVAWVRDGAALHLHIAGRTWRVADLSRVAAARGGDSASDGKLRASMNGRVVAVLVAVGDLVAAGQPLLTLEAMKMEHVHAAPITGRVAALHVSLGEQVASHRVVAEVVAEPATAAAPAAVAS